MNATGSKTLFERGPDGMVKGPVYSPITGSPDPCLPKTIPKSLCSYVQYSDDVRLSTTSVLNQTSTIKANSTVSQRELNADRTKHHRAWDGPEDKYTKPLTSSMEHGWSEYAKKPKTPQFGRIACKETKIAEDHILGPRHA